MSLLRDNGFMGEFEPAPCLPAAYDATLQGEALYAVVAHSGVEVGRTTGLDDEIIANAGLIKRFESDLGPCLRNVTIEFLPDGTGDGLIIFARRRGAKD